MENERMEIIRDGVAKINECLSNTIRYLEEARQSTPGVPVQLSLRGAMESMEMACGHIKALDERLREAKGGES